MRCPERQQGRHESHTMNDIEAVPWGRAELQRCQLVQGNPRQYTYVSHQASGVPQYTRGAPRMSLDRTYGRAILQTGTYSGRLTPHAKQQLGGSAVLLASPLQLFVVAHGVKGSIRHGVRTSCIIQQARATTGPLIGQSETAALSHTTCDGPSPSLSLMMQCSCVDEGGWGGGGHLQRRALGNRRRRC